VCSLNRLVVGSIPSRSTITVKSKVLRQSFCGMAKSQVTEGGCWKCLTLSSGLHNGSWNVAIQCLSVACLELSHNFFKNIFKP